jgi:hypothetical protein
MRSFYVPLVHALLAPSSFAPGIHTRVTSDSGSLTCALADCESEIGFVKQNVFVPRVHALLAPSAFMPGIPSIKQTRSHTHTALALT